MAAQPLFGTVLHLTATGHVLAATTSGAHEPTVEALTGADGLRMRIPATDLHVDVPAALLTASRVAVTADVLDRPLFYVFGDGAVPLSLGIAPVFDPSTDPTGTAGDKVVVVWQTNDAPVPDDSVLGTGGVVPSVAPPGAIGRLIAFEGGPVWIESL